MNNFLQIAVVVSSMWIGWTAHKFVDDDSMRHSWLIENMQCRMTDETRTILGVDEAKWTCDKQDAFWRPITE
jgi:hypothetical protein